MKIKKKKNFFFFLGGGGPGGGVPGGVRGERGRAGGGVRMEVNEELKFL